MNLTPPVIGKSEYSQVDHAECGKLAAEAIISLAHPGASLPIPDNATASQIVNAIRTTYPDVTASMASGNAADVAAIFIPEGYYVLGLVFCTGQAVPTPPPGQATHWIGLYGISDDHKTQDYYQCWNASLQSIGNLAECSEVGNGYHVLIKLPTGGTDMSMSEGEKLLTVSNAFVTIRASSPPGDALEPFVKEIKDDGSNAVAVRDSILNSDEGKANLARLAAVLNGTATNTTTTGSSSTASLEARIAAIEAQLAKVKTDI